ncbi:MAG: hypothetical protein A2Y40_07670 [Candidatus Margulisbacteria bacterium GWF2_35_9]|nr:MAG: hypothetical protein A2Y40_07670 [Candidatus Margulisbacteria bacterium GWF2_35_9]
MNKHYMRIFIILCLMMNSFQSIFAQDTVTLSDTDAYYSITTFSGLYVDKHAQKSFDEIKELDDFKLIQHEIVNNGNTKSAYWMKFIVKNKSTENKRWFVKVDGPTIDYVNFYNVLTDKGIFEVKRVSNSLPFKEREILHRSGIFDLKIASGQQKTFYIKLKTDSLMAYRLVIMNQDKLFATDHIAQLAFGFYYGLLVVMLFYNTVLLFMYKDRNYFYYILFIAAWIPLQMCFNGIGFEYLWPSFPWVEKIAGGFFGSLTGFIMLLFSRSFLRTSELIPKIDKVLNVLSIFFITLTIASMFVDPIYLTIVLREGSLITILLLIYSGFSCYKKGYKPARTYLLGWTIHLLFSLAYVLMLLNLIPISVFLEYSINVSSALLIIILSIALVDRMNLIRAEILSQEKLAGIRKELNLARSLQQSIIPQEMPIVSGLSVYAKYIPMKDVGGDFYDLKVGDDQSLSAIIADVSGHGISAALIASMVKIAYSVESTETIDPEKILVGMNNILYKQFERMLITATVLNVNPVNKCLTMACAGHVPTLIYRRRQEFLEILESERGFPIGLFKYNVFHRIESKVYTGDRIIMYTDCIIESKNENNELFGEKRFADFVCKNYQLSLKDFSDELLKTISLWTGTDVNFDDDYTIIIIDIE